MISRNFLKSSILYTLAGALPIASSVILLPVYNYFLPIEIYGALSVYTTYAMLVQVLVTYSFDSSLYLYFHEYKNDLPKLGSFVSSAFIFMAVLGGCVAIVSILTGTLLFDTLLGDKPVSFYPYGLLSVGTAIFQAFLKVHSSLLQTRQQPALYFWSNLLSFSLIAIFTVAGLYLFPGTLVGPVGGRMLAATLSGIWVLYRIVREFGIQYNWPLLKTSFTFNNTSFIYQVQQWLISYFDRLLMTFYLTLTVVGTYDFAFKCLLMIDFIFGGLYTSFLPKVIGIVVAQEKKESTVTINRYYHGIIAVTMVLVCGSIIAFPILIKMGLIREGYKAAGIYIPFLAVIYLAKGVKFYFNMPYGALRYVKPLPYIYIVVSGVKIGLMVLLIHRFNVAAVIASAMVSTVLEIVLLRLGIRKKFEFHFNGFKLIIAPAVLAATIITLELLDLPAAPIRHAFYLVFCGGLLFWLYRNELKTMKWPFKKAVQ